MASPDEYPRLELRGLSKRGRTRGAVLALAGARRRSLERATELVSAMTESSILVAVDGGLRTCRAAGRRPDLFVGDGDSAPRVPTDVEAVVYARDKDHSDLAGALGEMERRRVRVVAVAGLLGGRLDHEWANLLELGQHARRFAGILAPTGRGTVLVTSHGCKTATVQGRTFSVFALTSAATVSLRGVEWELSRRRLRPGSHGLSNVTGTRLDLTVHQGTVVLVLLPPARQRSSG